MDNMLKVYLLLQLIFTLLLQLQTYKYHVFTNWVRKCELLSFIVCTEIDSVVPTDLISHHNCQWTGETNYRWTEAHLALWPGRWVPPLYSFISNPRCVHWTQTASGPPRAVAGASFPPDLAGITHRLLWHFISIEPKWPKAVWHCSDIKQQ